MWYFTSFSIPYRIELAVTRHRKTNPGAGSHFQYPLSDRTRCNLQRRQPQALGFGLSVSPIGSNSL